MSAHSIITGEQASAIPQAKSKRLAAVAQKRLLKQPSQTYQVGHALEGQEADPVEDILMEVIEVARARLSGEELSDVSDGVGPG